MSNLRSTIEALASQFATSVLDALRSASIDELVAVAGWRLLRVFRVVVARTSRPRPSAFDLLGRGRERSGALVRWYVRPARQARSRRPPRPSLGG